MHCVCNHKSAWIVLWMRRSRHVNVFLYILYSTPFILHIALYIPDSTPPCCLHCTVHCLFLTSSLGMLFGIFPILLCLYALMYISYSTTPNVVFFSNIPYSVPPYSLWPSLHCFHSLFNNTLFCTVHCISPIPHHLILYIVVYIPYSTIENSTTLMLQKVSNMVGDTVCCVNRYIRLVRLSLDYKKMV